MFFYLKPKLPMSLEVHSDYYKLRGETERSKMCNTSNESSDTVYIDYLPYKSNVK